MYRLGGRIIMSRSVTTVESESDSSVLKKLAKAYGSTIETTYQNDNGILTRRFEVIEILESKLEDRSVVSEK